MLEDHISIILYVIGGITASMIFQFMSPRAYLKAFNGLDVTDEISIFFARSAGAPIAMIGLLIIWAGYDPALRVPVLTAALIGKAAFVSSIALHAKSVAKGYVLAALFDGTAIIIFAVYLLGQIGS